jgi:hypothetical protein
MIHLLELNGACGAHIGENGVNALLVDQADACGGESDADEAVFAFNPETTALQIREETAFGFVVGVRNIVSHHRLFAGDLTYASHEGTPVTTDEKHCAFFATTLFAAHRLGLNAANVKWTARVRLNKVSRKL